jgi:hypothetical protein
VDLEALADAYVERMAICLAEGITPDEAEQTAALEIGRELARRFDQLTRHTAQAER